jgi:hypothetical protein
MRYKYNNNGSSAKPETEQSKNSLNSDGNQTIASDREVGG